MSTENFQPDAGGEASPRADDASLGTLLKRARETQGLTLEQVSAELRIELPLLEALEADRLDRLDAPVFAKGYLKQYGNRLGLSYQDLVSRYHAAVGTREVIIEPSRTIRLRDDRQVTLWVVGLVTLLLLGVVLFVWWVGGAGDPVELIAPAPDDTPAATRDVPPRASTASAAGAAPEPADADAGGVAVDGADPPPADAAAFADVAAAPMASAGASTDNSAPPSSGDVRIELSFSSDSWTEVTDARGERLVYGLGRAGERETVEGDAPVSLLLGNADAVSLVVDGEPMPIPSGARRGNLAEFTIGESGARQDAVPARIR